jgi:hypothetical protein
MLIAGSIVLLYPNPNPSPWSRLARLYTANERPLFACHFECDAVMYSIGLLTSIDQSQHAPPCFVVIADLRRELRSQARTS